MHFHSGQLIALCTILLLSFSEANAGRLYARKAGTASPLYNLRLQYIRTHVTIENLLAVTHVDESFRNDQGIDLEGFYIFQLPDGAVVDGLWMWVEGKRYVFEVKRKEKAQQQYDSLVQHGIGDPAILETLGANRFQLRIHPIKAGEIRRIELRYFQTLSINTLGIARYYYPLNLADYQTVPVDTTDISITIRSDVAIDSVKTNFDALPGFTRTTILDTSRATVAFGLTSVVHQQDLVIDVLMTKWFDRFTAMSYAARDTIDDGYFMLWTPLKPDPGKDVKADFVFLLDASSSMTGLRIPTVKEAIANVLLRLQAYDRFRIVLFSGTTVSFPSDTSLLFATPENITVASIFLEANYKPRGLTHYENAFRNGLSGAFRQDASVRVLFITDGLPNAGRKTITGLDSAIAASGAPFARVFPIPIFTENLTLLDQLAKGHNGKMALIEQGEDLSTVLDRIAFDFTKSGYRNVSYTYPGSWYRIYPDTIPWNSSPEEIVLSGRYQIDGTFPLPMSVFDINRNSQVDITKPVTLFADSIHIQVARYWAAKRIEELLRSLKFVTDSTEIKESIIRLSERFNILSPFTAFIVVRIEDPNVSFVEGYGTLPQSVSLHPAYPNPFVRGEPGTISFTVPSGTTGRHATLVIYDVAGREIVTLFDGIASPGLNIVRWNGLDRYGKHVPPGVFFCALRMGGILRTIRIIVI